MPSSRTFIIAYIYIMHIVVMTGFVYDKGTALWAAPLRQMTWSVLWLTSWYLVKTR
jgi:hypothetical protein